MDSPVEKENGKNILGKFKNCFTAFNVPITIQTDNGTEFENSIMNQFHLR